MNVTGLLKLKKETQQVSDSFKKREFVLTDNSTQYEQHISFQLIQDKCDLIDNINEGQEITVHFNLRGREWTNPQGEVKYFNSLDAWKIDASSSAPVDREKVNNSAPDDEDLPF